MKNIPEAIPDKFTKIEGDIRAFDRQRKSDAPKLINPVPNPRFDEVYHSGIAWLESL